MQQALPHLTIDDTAAAELRLAEHHWIADHDRDPGFEARAHAVAEEIVRLAKVLGRPMLEAEGLARMGSDQRAADAFAAAGAPARQADMLRRLGERHFEAQRWAPAAQAYAAARRVEPPLTKRPEAFAHSAQSASAYPKAAYATLQLGRLQEAFDLSDSGKTRFLRSFAGRGIPEPDFRSRLAAVGEATVVLPLVTEHGTSTFVVPPHCTQLEPVHVLHGGPPAHAWHNLVTTWIQGHLDYVRTQDVEAWEARFTHICEQLWVMGVADWIPHLPAPTLTRTPAVVLVPPNLLAPLPWHAAQRPDGHYPLADYTLTYAPGLAVMAGLKRPSSTTGRGVRAFVNPNDDLPFSRYELQSLQRGVPADKLECWTGPTATCKEFFAQPRQPTTLHFACHGFQHWTKPLETGIRSAAPSAAVRTRTRTPPAL